MFFHMREQIRFILSVSPRLLFKQFLHYIYLQKLCIIFLTQFPHFDDLIVIVKAPY